MSDINKDLFGVIQPEGKWHKFNKSTEYGTRQRCSCGESIYNPEDWEFHNNPDYFSKEGFVDLLEWTVRQDWFDDFRNYCWNIYIGFATCLRDRFFYQWLWDYKTFAKHLHEFLVQKRVIK